MRLGTFVMGGLAGAALVMLMQRSQNMSAVTGSIGNIGSMVRERVNNVKENLIERGIELKFNEGLLGSMGKNNQQQNSIGQRMQKQNNHGTGVKAQTDGLDKVEHLASRDPHVKHDVNEILEDNAQHPI